MNRHSANSTLVTVAYADGSSEMFTTARDYPYLTTSQAGAEVRVRTSNGGTETLAIFALDGVRSITIERPGPAR